MGIKSILAISLFAVLLIGMISFDDTFAAMCSEVSDESSCTAISFCGWEDNMCVISLPTTGTIEVTKDVLPSTIDLAGSAGQEITTITIDVAGYSIDQNMETVFLMDASGSVGSSGWNMVKDFVVDIINTGIPESDPIGIVRFSTPTLTQIIWDFADDQDRDVLTNVVAGLHLHKVPLQLEMLLKEQLTYLNRQAISLMMFLDWYF